MANNPFSTPSSPWALPPATLGTLFNTTARVTRLTTRWASPTGAYVNLKGNWASTGVAASNTGFGHALKYLATGTGSEATAAYTGATTEPAASSQFETDSPRLFSQSAPYVYAWCNGALTGPQNTALITLIENNNNALETNISSLGKYLLDGPGNGNVGMPGYIFGVIAITGAGGAATDRRANLRNLVQNMCLYMAELYNEGIWHSYNYIFDYLAACVIAYHIATGETALLSTRAPFLFGRGEILARSLSSNLNSYFRTLGPYNTFINSTGRIFSQFAGETWACALISDLTRDTTMAWVREQQLAHSTPTAWSHLQLNSDPTWLGFLFYDDTLVGVSPTTAALAKNKAFPVTGVAEFRGGWNQATDLCVQFHSGPTAKNDHSNPKPGHIQIRVGNTFLVADGYNYGHRNSPWENAVPSISGEVGSYSMCLSCPGFSPSATQATREDRDGSAMVSTPAGSGTAFPISQLTTNGVRTTWKGGAMGTMFDDGSLAKVTGVLTNHFPQMTSVQTTVAVLKGATSDVGTVVVYDQFTAPATVDHIRRNFWSKVKPIPAGAETVLQGSSSAGVVSWAGSSVVIKSGSYQATIQIVTPFSKIHGVGGAGFESFFDGYTSGGANLDYATNSGSPPDSRIATAVGWMQNQWRTSFQTSQSTALGEMLYVITVGAAGTTAPSYTKTQALSLLVPSGGVTSMPGFSTFAQKQGLDFLSGNNSVGLPTLFAALFTTLPLDDGSGGVEVSGTGYARVALSSSTFSLASGGAPATTTNALAFSFPVAGASWGTVVGVGFFDASTSGNYWGGDFLGTDPWKVFECTLASPGVLTSAGHGYSNGDLVEVTAKYGGTLPTTGGTWVGALTVANVTTNTFTAGVNTTSVGDGMVRKVLSQAVASAATVTIPIGSITLSLG